MRILTNICTTELQTSKAFYIRLLDLKVKYESDWYIQLCCPDNAEMEYGLIQQNHDLIPPIYQTMPTGMYVTFVVDNLDAYYEKALAMEAKILQPPRNEFYGQRRFLVQDPNGCLLDICSPWEEE
ncbi:hypothetical protein CBF23_002520 [Marinomonas agarivorans]|nr:hypothetical protein CBF23_002520 [Marinomonas agarivorans]